MTSAREFFERRYSEIYVDYMVQLNKMKLKRATGKSFDTGDGSLVKFPKYKNVKNEIDALKYEDSDKFYKDTYKLTVLKTLLAPSTDYIVELPEIKTKEKTAVVKKVSPSRMSKIKTKVISDMLNTFPFAQFPFKTIDECKSKSRTSSYYVSKESIINTIKGDAYLKTIVPKKYTTLNKSDLCDALFANKNG
jgi:hypothetical protein